MQKSMADHKTPIWPALLEKAYAQMMGGYDKIGDRGGLDPGLPARPVRGDLLHPQLDLLNRPRQ
jgi:hypothetical protein